MGKRRVQQRRGKGSSVFRAKARGECAAYVSYSEEQKQGAARGQVIGLIKENGGNRVLARVLFEGNAVESTIAAEGLVVGQAVEYGSKAVIGIGNTLPLSALPEGCPVFNVEKQPGDGGKLVRGTGGYALLVSKDNSTAYLKMPSGKTLAVNPLCRATIGCVAGGGRTEKPLVKAGNKWKSMRAKSRRYPVTRGVAMNPVAHPFGGGQHHPGKSESTSRGAHPGRKVGHIASKRTGRRKKN
jgi:large subunit ribosomal protein L2